MQLRNQQDIVQRPVERSFVSGYGLVRRAIAVLSAPSPNHGPAAAGDLASHLGVSPAHLEQVLFDWCGLSPATFAQAMTAEHIRGVLANAVGSLDGSAPGRGPIHAFEVRIAATITDEARRRGAGLDIVYGFHASPFGEALLAMTEDGICGIAFADEDMGGRRTALDDMRGRWPQAVFHETPEVTEGAARRIFQISGPGQPVPLILIGTPFDLEVWQTLLKIPMGQLVSYTHIANHLGRPAASRAVGTANGRNPISFVVPCHRALRGDGSLGGYYWGLARKRALIAWEMGRASARERSALDAQAVGEGPHVALGGDDMLDATRLDAGKGVRQALGVG
jgi:AraC family transcriptional regulator of adaptative response/methylated-DNA-[protein]-cysteine methyltransferase